VIFPSPLAGEENLNHAAIRPRFGHIRALLGCAMRGSSLLADGRHFQIAALGTLVALSFFWLDFGAKPLASGLAIAGTLATQALCTRLWRLPRLDLRSPLITGFSLSLLLRADEPLLFALAGLLAIGSKFLLRIDGKHIWNPAGFAIVALLLFAPDHVWLSPGQWGAEIWFATLLVFFAILVLQASARADIALFFLASHAALLVARALWLGDPLAIPLHQLESGSLLIFAFFMITDPKTTPDARIARLALAVAVAGLAHYLAFFLQMRPALYLALAVVSLAVPALDRLFRAERFAWTRPALPGASP
jgi:Na+-transporting NADH:ubiquinone oxidoreductase subunit NqrB